MPVEEERYGHDRLSRGRELFNRMLEPDSGDTNDTLYNFFRAAVIVVAAAFFNLIALAIIFQNTDKIGQAGDFFGGFVNPLLTFLTFSGVLFTVYIQRQDLTETRKETREQTDFFERQNFEVSFFQMLNLHNQIVSAMVGYDDSHGFEFKGRSAFKMYFLSFKKCFDKIDTAQPSKPEQETVDEAFKLFWGSHRQELGHYFRYLFNIIRFVDDAKISRSESDTENLKHKYMKLLRAQLSDYELLLIYYNALTESGLKFVSYINEYELLDNIPRELLVQILHPSIFRQIVVRSAPVDK